MSRLPNNEDLPYSVLWEANEASDGSYLLWDDISNNEAIVVTPNKNSSFLKRISARVGSTVNILRAGLTEFCGALIAPFTAAQEHFKRQSQKTPDEISASQTVMESPPRLSKKILHKTYIPQLAARFGEQLRSPEFWLGVTFGAATRITTRLAIEAAFSSEHKSFAKAISFIACASAGLAAGIVTFFVRTYYRNAQLPEGQPKVKYFSRNLLESAFIGLFGGIIGGCAVNVGTIIAQSGSFAIGATTGVVAGATHVGVKGAFATKSQRAKMKWGKMALQSALFGSIGGALGVVTADLFNAHGSAAAPVPVGNPDAMDATPPPIPPPQSGGEQLASDSCNDCEAPSVLVITQPPAPEPVHSVTVGSPHIIQLVQPPPLMMNVNAPLPAHPVVHHYHHHHHHVHHHVVPCEPAKVKHVTHLKHLKHMKTYHAHHIMPPPPPYIENVYIIQQSAPPPLPTTVVIPLSTTPPPQAVVQPQAVGQPCATGDCEIPCESTSQIDIKGPCADPNQPCVERVSFNNDGDATGITLEPRTSPNSQAHFELSTPPATDAPSWSKVAQATTTTNTDSSDDSTHVSLVVPFMKSAYASLASAGPVPA